MIRLSKSLEFLNRWRSCVNVRRRLDIIRDLKQTLEAARWTSTGSKISRSRANYHNHVEFCPRPPTVAAVRKVGFTASRDGHFIFRFVARKIHGNSSI